MSADLNDPATIARANTALLEAIMDELERQGRGARDRIYGDAIAKASRPTYYTSVVNYLSAHQSRSVV